MPEVLAAQLALLPAYLSRHLLLSVTALGAGIALSLPLALAVCFRPRLKSPLMLVASAVQTIPGLALLALMVPLLRQIGFLPALIALILYSMLPILRNTIAGIDGVDANLVEAGQGVGMSRAQLLFRVQLPLALPYVIAGIRTATVWVVGMATLSTPVGATSLGNYIFSGLQTLNFTAVTVGCIAAAALALILDAIIHSVEVALRRRSRRLLVAATAAFVAFLGIGLWPLFDAAMARDGRARASVVIGSKTFTEQYILAATISDLLEAAGYETRTLDSLGSTVAFDALRTGSIDVYVDYAGTIWANYMQRRGNPGRSVMLEQVRAWLDREHGILVAASPGFENAYALAMRATDADARQVRSIEDLVPLAAGMRIAGDYEFFARPEWTALENAYQLAFAEQVTMDSTLMYSALAESRVDVISAFSTDGRIPAFDLQVLDDPRGALPPYDALVLTRRDGPAGLRDALRALDGAIGSEAMRAANQRVDLEGEPVMNVAAGLAETIRKTEEER